jgi:membrane protein
MTQGNRMENVTEFLKTGIWRVRLQDYRGFKRFSLRYLKIFLIAGEQFMRDNCLLWASALTYYSLLSIVPVFALGFAVAKGFGLQTYLQKLALEQFAGQGEVAARLLDFSNNLLSNTSGGVIAGVGALFLIWSVFQLLANAEQAFNSIWEIKKGRPLGRKLSDYLSIMLVSPVFIVSSSSAMVLLATQINELLARLGLGLFAPVITLILGIVPYVLIWLLLTFIYVFLPNTKVNPVSGIVGGILAGTFYVLVQWLYIKFQVGVASYNAIYGSFAALPLFIIWMNLSWLIVLIGIEIVYAHQHQESYMYEHVVGKISPYFRKLMTLQVTHLLVKNFRDGGHPLRVSHISAALEIPRRLVMEILETLNEAGLAVEIPVEGSNRKTYQPARDIDLYTMSYVIGALAHAGVPDNIPAARTDSYERISQSLLTFAELMEKSDANMLLKEI